MTYLRNLAVLAEKQTQALDAAGVMPHLLVLYFELYCLNFEFFEVALCLG
jgi:hypothetical protein